MPFLAPYNSNLDTQGPTVHTHTHTRTHTHTGGPHRARAVLAAICPALVLPVDDPLDAAGSLTIAAIEPIHLLLRPGQLLTPTSPHPPRNKRQEGEKMRVSLAVRVYIHM